MDSPPYNGTSLVEEHADTQRQDTIARSQAPIAFLLHPTADTIRFGAWRTCRELRFRLSGRVLDNQLVLFRVPGQPALVPLIPLYKRINLLVSLGLIKSNRKYFGVW